MPSIFDNIEQQLFPRLRETLKLTSGSDLCVGYFNLRGCKSMIYALTLVQVENGTFYRLLIDEAVWLLVATLRRPIKSRVVQGYEILEIKPPTGLESFFDGKSPKLWGLGDPAILERKLLGIISARQIDSDLALKSSQLLKQLASLKEVSFIGGWHSPLEEEALRILSADSARIVLCVSKALHRFVPSLQVKNGIIDGRVLLLTHCSPKAKRISRDASLRRNHLIVGLAGALLVLSAPEGSASLKLAKSALRHGVPVFTPEHRMNKELFGCNALAATLDSIRAVLG